MKKSKILLSPPHMNGDEMEYIKEAFNSNWIAPLGSNVDAFEKEIAHYVGANDAIAVSSGTAAIHLALSLLDIKQGDIVFCSTFTFVASANPILYQGAEPVFIDSEPDTWNMSPSALDRAFKDAERTGVIPKAVIVVNLYGQPAKMDEIISICDQYNVPIIEDAAESLGSIYKGKASGTLGKFGVFSFNGNKIITTSSGGMLVSDDCEAIQKARFLAAQAKDSAPYYQHSQVGFNYRMSNILAALGRSQLKVLEQRVEARRNIFNAYNSFLEDLPGISFMPELEYTRSNRWLTALTISEENSDITVSTLLKVLEDENIEARHVWKPLHMQPLFKNCKYFSHFDNEHVAEQLFKTGLCLPSGSSMTTAEQILVIHTILETIKKTNTPTVY